MRCFVNEKLISKELYRRQYVARLRWCFNVSRDNIWPFRHWLRGQSKETRQKKVRQAELFLGLWKNSVFFLIVLSGCDPLSTVNQLVVKLKTTLKHTTLNFTQNFMQSIHISCFLLMLQSLNECNYNALKNFSIQGNKNNNLTAFVQDLHNLSKTIYSLDLLFHNMIEQLRKKITLNSQKQSNPNPIR